MRAILPSLAAENLSINPIKANKEAGYIHNRTSRTALAPLVSVLVCVCNRLSLFQISVAYSVGTPVREYCSIPHKEMVCQLLIGGFYKLLWKNAAFYGIL